MIVIVISIIILDKPQFTRLLGYGLANLVQTVIVSISFEFGVFFVCRICLLLFGAFFIVINYVADLPIIHCMSLYLIVLSWGFKKLSYQCKHSEEHK